MALSKKPPPQLLEVLLKTKIDKQLTNWLAYYLSINKRIAINLSEINSPFTADKLGNLINENRLDENQIAHDWSLAKTDTSLISWIKDEERQLQWIINYITKHQQHNISLHLTTLHGIELIKTTLDTLTVKVPENKKNVIEQIKKAWFEHIKEDRIFEWFEKEDQTARYQAAWAWASKQRYQTYLKKEFSNKKELLMFFDELDIGKEEKKHIVTSIKNKYSQDKRRNNQKEKKQFNLNLKITTLKKLGILAKEYKLSKTEIIDILVDMETSNPIHIPKRDKYVQMMLGQAPNTPLEINSSSTTEPFVPTE